MKRSILSNAYLKVIKFGKWAIEGWAKGWKVIARLGDGYPYW